MGLKFTITCTATGGTVLQSSFTGRQLVYNRPANIERKLGNKLIFGQCYLFWTTIIIMKLRNFLHQSNKFIHGSRTINFLGKGGGGEGLEGEGRGWRGRGGSGERVEREWRGRGGGGEGVERGWEGVERYLNDIILLLTWLRFPAVQYMYILTNNHVLQEWLYLMPTLLDITYMYSTYHQGFIQEFWWGWVWWGGGGGGGGAGRSLWGGGVGEEVWGAVTQRHS